MKPVSNPLTFWSLVGLPTECKASCWRCFALFLILSKLCDDCQNRVNASGCRNYSHFEKLYTYIRSYFCIIFVLIDLDHEHTCIHSSTSTIVYMSMHSFNGYFVCITVTTIVLYLPYLVSKNNLNYVKNYQNQFRNKGNNGESCQWNSTVLQPLGI